MLIRRISYNSTASFDIDGVKFISSHCCAAGKYTDVIFRYPSQSFIVKPFTELLYTSLDYHISNFITNYGHTLGSLVYSFVRFLRTTSGHVIHSTNFNQLLNRTFILKTRTFANLHTVLQKICMSFTTTFDTSSRHVKDNSS